VVGWFLRSISTEAAPEFLWIILLTHHPPHPHHRKRSTPPFLSSVHLRHFLARCAVHCEFPGRSAYNRLKIVCPSQSCLVTIDFRRGAIPLEGSNKFYVLFPLFGIRSAFLSQTIVCSSLHGFLKPRTASRVTVALEVLFSGPPIR